MSDRARAREREARYRKRNRAILLAKQKQRQKGERAWFNALKGDACSRCQATGLLSHALHFHHRDPATKSFGLGDNMTRSRAAILAEVAKCDVLCWSCHPRVHAEMRRAR